MGVVKMTRVDYRLVHGQIGSNWIRELSIDKIIIPCDEVVEDPFMVEMFEMASPPGTKIVAYSVEEAVKKWDEDQYGEGNILILFRYIADAYKAYNLGLKYESLNVANVHASPERKYASSTVHLSTEEMHMLLELQDKHNVNVYNQAIPMDKVIKLDKLIKNLR